MRGSIDLGPGEAALASRRWWDSHAAAYQAEHGDFLGPSRLVWGPDGLDEAEAGLLGPLAGRTVVELGCGAAQGTRWAAAEGATAIGLDLSGGQLVEARRVDRSIGAATRLVQADACRLPFAASSVDVAFAAYGAVQFTPDLGGLLAEVARVLRPSGRWVFSVTHPVRWAFPDDPGRPGLTARFSYFDRRPYVERGEAGEVTYSEHHRTLGDYLRGLVGAGFRVVDLVEPQWPDGLTTVWGGWSPLRGRLLPGTAIFVTVLAGRRADLRERGPAPSPGS